MRVQKCTCCGSTKQLEWDHIIALANGGSNRRDNLQRLCRRCNLSKGNREACEIDHSMDYPNELSLIAQNGQHGERIEVNKGLGLKREDGLAPFSTRLNAEKKADLLKQARNKGVAAGQIIEELMDDRTAEILARIESKLDLLMKQLPHHSKSGIAQDPEVLFGDDRFPHADMRPHYPTPRLLDAPVVELQTYPSWWRRLWCWVTCR